MLGWCSGPVGSHDDRLAAICRLVSKGTQNSIGVRAIFGCALQSRVDRVSRCFANCRGQTATDLGVNSVVRCPAFRRADAIGLCKFLQNRIGIRCALGAKPDAGAHGIVAHDALS